MDPELHAISLLAPYDIHAPEIWRGPATDDGYVFIDDLLPDQAIVSYRISCEYRFAEEMAEHGHEAYMFDYIMSGITASNPQHDVVQGGRRWQD